MFEIYKNNSIIAITDKVVYIKKHPTMDSYVPASKEDAEGIAVQALSQVFALMGKELSGLEQVVVVETDGGTHIKNTDADVQYIAEILSIGNVSGMSEKDRAVAQTHRWLKSEIRKGMVWDDDGGLYNITDRKQNNLLMQLMVGSIQVVNGANPDDVVLRWNRSGEPNVDWEYTRLCKLACDIRNYVDYLVVKQQKAEEQIIKAKSNDKIEKILRGFQTEVSVDGC